MAKDGGETMTAVTRSRVTIVADQLEDSAEESAEDSAEIDECTDAELLSLVRSHPHGSRAREDACALLVERYQALVRSCVLRYRDSPEPTEELMQVGYVGLLKAINNFDAGIGGRRAADARPCSSRQCQRRSPDKRTQSPVPPPAPE